MAFPFVQCALIFVSQINEPEETTKMTSSLEKKYLNMMSYSKRMCSMGEDYHAFLVRLQKQVRSGNGVSMKLLRRKMKTITFHGPKVGLKLEPGTNIIMALRGLKNCKDSQSGRATVQGAHWKGIFAVNNEFIRTEDAETASSAIEKCKRRPISISICER